MLSSLGPTFRVQHGSPFHGRASSGVERGGHQTLSFHSARRRAASSVCVIFLTHKRTRVEFVHVRARRALAYTHQKKRFQSFSFVSHVARRCFWTPCRTCLCLSCWRLARARGSAACRRRTTRCGRDREQSTTPRFAGPAPCLREARRARWTCSARSSRGSRSSWTASVRPRCSAAFWPAPAVARAAFGEWSRLSVREALEGTLWRVFWRKKAYVDLCSSALDHSNVQI